MKYRNDKTWPAPNSASAGFSRPCARRDLERWSEHGGALPASLARHVRVCAACAAHVRRVNEVCVGLKLLRTTAIPAGLPKRANSRALRMLRRAARASASAARVLKMQPGLSIWQRAGLHAKRMSMGVAASFMMLVLRAGLFGGLEKTQTLGEQLAQDHWDRHIDPDGEWLDSNRFA